MPANDTSRNLQWTGAGLSVVSTVILFASVPTETPALIGIGIFGVLIGLLVFAAGRIVAP